MARLFYHPGHGINLYYILQRLKDGLPPPGPFLANGETLYCLQFPVTCTPYAVPNAVGRPAKVQFPTGLPEEAVTTINAYRESEACRHSETGCHPYVPLFESDVDAPARTLEASNDGHHQYGNTQLTLLIDEEEDPDVRIRHFEFEKSFLFLLPENFKLLFRMRYKDNWIIVVPPMTNYMVSRTKGSPPVLGQEADGGHWRVLTSDNPFTCIRDWLDGHPFKPGWTEEVCNDNSPVMGKLMRIFPLRLNNDLKSLHRELMYGPPQMGTTPQTSGGRKLMITAPPSIPAEHVLPGSHSLLFGLTLPVPQLTQPDLPEDFTPMSVSALYRMGDAFKPFMVMTRNHIDYIGAAFIPAASTFSEDYYPELTHHEVKYMENTRFRLRRMNFYLLIPLLVRRGRDDTNYNSNTRYRFPQLSDETNDAIASEPLLGAALNDMLMTLRGRLKKNYPDLNNIESIAAGDFPVSLRYTSVADKRSMMALIPDPQWGTPNRVSVVGQSYELLENHYLRENLYQRLCDPKYSNLPKTLFGRPILQPVAPKKTRLLAM